MRKIAYIVELLTGFRPTPGGGTDTVTYRSMAEGAESRCQWTPEVEAERLAKVGRKAGRGCPDKNG